MVHLQNLTRVPKNASIHEDEIDKIDEEIIAWFEENSENFENGMFPMLGDVLVQCMEIEVMEMVMVMVEEEVLGME